MLLGEEKKAGRKIAFGKTHRGKTYMEVYLSDPDYCDWLQTEATHITGAMRQFLTYLEMRQHADIEAHAPP